MSEEESEIVNIESTEDNQNRNETPPLTNSNVFQFPVVLIAVCDLGLNCLWSLYALEYLLAFYYKFREISNSTENIATSTSSTVSFLVWLLLAVCVFEVVANGIISPLVSPHFLGIRSYNRILIGVPLFAYLMGYQIISTVAPVSHVAALLGLFGSSIVTDFETMTINQEITVKDVLLDAILAFLLYRLGFRGCNQASIDLLHAAALDDIDVVERLRWCNLWSNGSFNLVIGLIICVIFGKLGTYILPAAFIRFIFLLIVHNYMEKLGFWSRNNRDFWYSVARGWATD